MLTRREILIGSAAVLTLPAGCARRERAAADVVNDIHSQLNPTRVARIASPRTIDDLPALVERARAEGRAISIAGGRHAMGGQQFGADTVLVDTRRMSRVLGFDPERGLVEVEAGIQWPALIDHLLRVQAGRPRQWGIVQKQTGADRLSLGGALGANVHGRGLTLKPFVADVEAFTLVDGAGRVLRCSRAENADLFRLAIGGYGLFGVIGTVTLRLAPRRKLQRVVEVIAMDDLAERFDRRIAEGFLFGDCQYATDPGSPDFLRRGVFSCYRPVDDRTPTVEGQKELSGADWDRLLYLSHADKRRAFEAYAAYYRSTDGQIYWSDTHQLSVYVDDYHAALDRRLGSTERATEMITEIYVPRPALGRFLDEVRADFRRHAVDLIYGTIRLIERDDESVLAWARQPWACVIFNLHTVHTEDGLQQSADALRRLIDLAVGHGGSYFLTYHRFAARRQVEACHPRFAEFLRLKRRHDPDERFQSEWYRHYRAMFADAL
ncbi:MAG: FAD-binding oxidoreductase [Candidatus Rokuibacteriota bacterium]